MMPDRPGKRRPIMRETRWSRTRGYSDETTTYTSFESKFLEGTASITLAELSQLWLAWNTEEKLDFSLAIACDESLKHAEVLRFLMKNGDHVVWSTIAPSVARGLPKKESLPFLRARCEETEVGTAGANYYQALTMAGDPDALRRLKEWLNRIMQDPRLGKQEPTRNYIALDLVWCIKYLLELGEPPETLRQYYELLTNHPNPYSRRYAQDRLSEYFA